MNSQLSPIGHKLYLEGKFLSFLYLLQQLHLLLLFEDHEQKSLTLKPVPRNVEYFHYYLGGSERDNYRTCSYLASFDDTSPSPTYCTDIHRPYNDRLGPWMTKTRMARSSHYISFPNLRIQLYYCYVR